MTRLFEDAGTLALQRTRVWNDGCVRVGDAGRPIGTDRQGRLTSTYSVIHGKGTGRVWTMHPGVPK